MIEVKYHELSSLLESLSPSFKEAMLHFNFYFFDNHCLNIYVSLKRWLNFFEFRTMMMKFLSLIFSQLARQGPAVTVTPVFIPMYY